MEHPTLQLVENQRFAQLAVAAASEMGFHKIKRLIALPHPKRQDTPPNAGATTTFASNLSYAQAHLSRAHLDIS
jgi:hypothetical protein